MLGKVEGDESWIQKTKDLVRRFRRPLFPPRRPTLVLGAGCAEPVVSLTIRALHRRLRWTTS